MKILPLTYMLTLPELKESHKLFSIVIFSFLRVETSSD